MEEQKKIENVTEPKNGNKDIAENKAMAIIGYIIPILFFVPLLSEAKNSKYAKFHANQQLNLLIFSAVAWFALVIVSFIFMITIILIPLVFLLLWIYKIAIIVFVVLGVISANKGEMKKLPLIGGFALIK
jgi:uncharacterized membrane protein